MKERTVVILSVLPAVTVIFLMFIWPLFTSADMSITDRAGNLVWFEYYNNLFNDPEFINAFWYSLYLAVVVMIVSSVSAVFLALIIRETFIGRKLVLFLVQYNMAMPTIAACAMAVFLLDKNGFLSKILSNVGIIGSYTEFPKLLYDQYGLGLIITIIWMFVPYIGMAVLAVLTSVTREHENQAKSLGVGKLKRFRYVILPSILPSLSLTSIICFACVFGSYEAPMLLSGRKTLIMLAYERHADLFDYTAVSESYAISMIVFLVILAVSLIFYFFMFRGENSE